MPVLAIDLGGTKISFALITEDGVIVKQHTTLLHGKDGHDVADMLISNGRQLIDGQNETVTAIGISVPGIFRMTSGTVWAPNIPGWQDYPLLEKATCAFRPLPVVIDSDRACYILGEVWKGNASGCSHAIYLAIGTGIGAGILINGEVLRGAHDIAGAIGWMALTRPYDDRYVDCGCFESFASGEGIASLARRRGFTWTNGSGLPLAKGDITAHHVFRAFEQGDEQAKNIITECVELWGMAAANLVSLFNPEKIIFGGGVFGPAVPLIPNIYHEASKWAQPIGIQQVTFEASGLANDAGLYGAAYLAVQHTKPKPTA